MTPNISKPITKRKPTGVNGVMIDKRPITTRMTPVTFLIFGFSVQIFLSDSLIFKFLKD